MGKFIRGVEPTERQFIVQLSQSEVDLLQGIVVDLLDNPQRRVRMAYEVDGDYVEPSKRGMEVLREICDTFLRIEQSPDYDYFDYWDEAKRSDEEV